MTIRTDYSNYPNLIVVHAEPLLKRIRRKLFHLEPMMCMYWSRPHGGYVVADTIGGRSYGPYDFTHFAAFAAHVGALHKGERTDNMLVLSLAGVTFPQLPKLPEHLRFAVITPKLKAALELLGEHGILVNQLISGKLKPEDDRYLAPTTKAERDARALSPAEPAIAEAGPVEASKPFKCEPVEPEDTREVTDTSQVD